MFYCVSVGCKWVQKFFQSIFPLFWESNVLRSSSISREVSPSYILRSAERKVNRSSFPEPSESIEQNISSMFCGLALIICCIFARTISPLYLDGVEVDGLYLPERKERTPVVFEFLRVFSGEVFVILVSKTSRNSSNVRLSRPLLTEFHIPRHSYWENLPGRRVLIAEQNSSGPTVSLDPVDVKQSYPAYILPGKLYLITVLTSVILCLQKSCLPNARYQSEKLMQPFLCGSTQANRFYSNQFVKLNPSKALVFSICA